MPERCFWLRRAALSGMLTKSGEDSGIRAGTGGFPVLRVGRGVQGTGCGTLVRVSTRADGARHRPGPNPRCRRRISRFGRDRLGASGEVGKDPTQDRQGTHRSITRHAAKDRPSFPAFKGSPGHARSPDFRIGFPDERDWIFDSADSGPM